MRLQYNEMTDYLTKKLEYNNNRKENGYQKGLLLLT